MCDYLHVSLSAYVKKKTSNYSNQSGSGSIWYCLALRALAVRLRWQTLSADEQQAH